MVPFVDLKAQYLAIKDEIDRAVLGVFDTAEFVLGREVATFEALFASFTQTTHAIGVNSGTSALHLALLAVGVGPGDEVITSPFTFVATAAAIDYCGATPVFVDVDPDTLTIDPTLIEAAITPRTRAIVPVHLYGQPADMDPIMEIARHHGLWVVEDAAQAHGAEYRGRRVGSIGDVACFSFYPGKNLGAYGDAGAVTTNDDAIAHAVRVRRDWGSERRYHHDVKGFNYRLAGVQGAVLRVKMDHIERWTEARRAVAARYDEALSGLAVSTLTTAEGRRHVYHLYVVRHPSRDVLQAFLHERGVTTGIHYPIPVHLQGAFAELGYRQGDFPHTEAAAREVLSLPTYPELSVSLQDEVVSALAEWSSLRRHRSLESVA